MNRRYFFRQLASGLLAAAAPAVFVPKLVKPSWSKIPVQAAVDLAEEGAWDGSVMCFVSFRPTVDEAGEPTLRMDEVAPPIRLPKDSHVPLAPGVKKTYVLGDNKVVVTTEPVGMPVCSYSLTGKQWTIEWDAESTWDKA